jgi:pyruvate kinase
MLLFGHRFIPSETFYHISDIDDITHTPPSSTLTLAFSEQNLDIISHLNLNQLTFALSVNNITDLIYASALNASYIIVPEDLAKTAQELAQNYLFDAKILVKIESDEDIEEMALLGMDGVIYPSAIIKIT